MFVLYIEKNAFEDISYFDEYPHWKKIISDDIQVCLNISEQELDNEFEDVESAIYRFYTDTASGNYPIATENFIEDIKSDYSLLREHHQPRSAFILDISEEEAIKLSTDYGLAILSSKKINDNYFLGGFAKDLAKGERIEEGWTKLINFDLPVSNSLIISDNHFFVNEEGGINCGLGNICGILDAFLPERLEVDFHVTILGLDGSKPESWWIKEFGRLKAQIDRLREYNIILELILTKTIHKRVVISNYLYGWADKGFDLFKNSNPEIIRDDFDLQAQVIFNNINDFGDSYYIFSQNNINRIKKICDEVYTYVIAEGNSSNRMIFGCPKKKINNPLLN